MPTEFGHMAWLEGVEGGILSGYRIPPEAGQDFPFVPDSLMAHQRRFGRPPRLQAADRLSRAGHLIITSADRRRSRLII
jgi:hypothetical protein